ncbi:unnamed protein product [Discula destructiva]
MDGPEEVLPDGSIPVNFDVIFYNPEQPRADKRLPSAVRPKWKQLAERIGAGKPFARLEAQTLLADFPPAVGSEKPVDTAKRLASDIVAKGDRIIRELLLVSFSEPRYLDRLKRGATFANTIIAELASRGPGNEAQQLDYATQTVLQARLTVSQWSTLNAYSTRVREYVSSLVLPTAQMEPSSSPPLFIPLLIESITNPSLQTAQISQCLGYDTNQTSFLKASYLERGHAAASCAVDPITAQQKQPNSEAHGKVDPEIGAFDPRATE